MSNDQLKDRVLDSYQKLFEMREALKNLRKELDET